MYENILNVVDYCKSGNFRGVEIFAHFAAKWSGAKIKTARILCQNVCLRVQACCPQN